MKTAVVILNWNGEKYLKQFLPILIKYTQHPEVELYVADNASTDQSLTVLNEQFPTVKIILLDKNYGFAGGYNKALAQIDSEYFVLLNSDVEVTENWLQILIDYMDVNHDVAACQPKVRSFYNRSFFEHAGAAGGFIDMLGFPFCRGRVIGNAEEDRGQYDDIVDIFWATGACLMIRSEIFKKAGGLDEAFFAHMEEIDLCWRLSSRGYRVSCIPQSVIYHVGGGTLHIEHPHKTYLNFRNNLLMLYKNLPQQTLSKTMNRRKLFDYLAAVQLFITGKPHNAKSVFRARYDFKKMLPDFEQKRKDNLLQATKFDDPKILKKSIVIEYFLKNCKTYRQLIK